MILAPASPTDAGTATWPSRNRLIRRRLGTYLDADPELLAALRIHLERARNDRPAGSTRRRPVPPA